MPCSSGHVPQAIEALLTLVTAGITPRTFFAKPLAIRPLRTGIVLCLEVIGAEAVDHHDHDALILAEDRARWLAAPGGEPRRHETEDDHRHDSRGADAHGGSEAKERLGGPGITSKHSDPSGPCQRRARGTGFLSP